MRVLVAAAEKSSAKNGSDFYRLQLIDENKRTFPAVWFDTSVEVGGQVCDVSVEEPSNPAHKPKVTRLSVISGADKTPFIKRSVCDPTEVFAWFKAKTRDSGIVTILVDDIFFGPEGSSDPKYAAIQQRFAEWPAAKGNHHAFAGGLLEHTYAMGRAAEYFMENDPAYCGLDAPLVYAAILLHDMAKLKEYDWVAPGPAERNPAGILLGHISMIDETIVKACQRLKIPMTSGKVLHLRHCLLSHHGREEWGSPVTPGSREAILVHQLDMIQSRGQMAKEAMETIGPGEREVNATLDTLLFNFGETNE